MYSWYVNFFCYNGHGSEVPLSLVESTGSLWSSLHLKLGHHLMYSSGGTWLKTMKSSWLAVAACINGTTKISSVFVTAVCVNSKTVILGIYYQKALGSPLLHAST